MELRFPAPSRPLSINRANTMHWAARARALKPWKEAVGYAWLVARPEWTEVKGKPCSIQMELAFPDKRRRDGHNYVPTVKACVDMLVQQGLCPDDTPEWIRVDDSVLVVGTECIVRITPR